MALQIGVKLFSFLYFSHLEMSLTITIQAELLNIIKATPQTISPLFELESFPEPQSSSSVWDLQVTQLGEASQSP